MARGNPFGNLFGKSPFQPIQDHMAKAHECAEALIPFLEAAMADDWEQATKHRSTITRLEGEADELKSEIRASLPKSLFLPVPRSDLLEVLSAQDKIANASKTISGLMMGRKMSIPQPITASFMEFVEEALATSAQALKAINELDELVETGFRGREVNTVEALIDELDRLEHRNDEQEIAIRASLFAIEKDLPPIDAMFLYKVIDSIGDLANRAQKVGSRLQIIIAR
ncbi:TIGR00153 family protein [Dasania sp. GY-MA-18]|uniref:TIGR00153 family protein n=1 Tax=Dasania phycosphaerae TaxID=2950436 RepID=A0A9J6RKM0_9GAMM|nr:MULTISPECIES: TIGR00153 family protein [Dasania]MCR8922105.1 TIGR00153 family protein [Dasania sp. GY-MA-18]MCZ0864533.1 TIGR00153 family protein [Dasania phycosphaerae]MCZ0868261.1 TIGR00153 family protein [Dasania phycosphaerae]